MRILLQSSDRAVIQSLRTVLHDYEVIERPAPSSRREPDSPVVDLAIVDLREEHASRAAVRALDGGDQRPAILALIAPAQAAPTTVDAALAYPADDETLRQMTRLLLQLAEERRERRRAGMMLRSLAESTDNGLLLTDRDGRIIFSNRAVERLFGYTPAEARDLATVEEMVPPERRATIYRARVALLNDPDGTSGIVQHWMHRDGTLVDTDVSAKRYFDRGEPAGLVVELRDVGEELQLRERLYDATARLFRVEVLQSQLRALTRHVGLVLRRFGQEQDAEAYDDLRSLERRAEELAADMRRILEPPEESPGPLSAKDLWDLADDAAGIARDLIGGRLHVEIAVDESIATVDVASADMSRLLRRLVAASCSPLQESLRNARVFTYEPELVVRVRLTGSRDGSTGPISIEVLHNGAIQDVPPVPPTVERFAVQYQAEVRAISRDADERSGFAVILPRVRVPAAAEIGASAPDVSALAAERATAPPPGEPSVLLVLDQVRLHEFLAPSLIEAGYRVRSVTSLDAAIRLLTQEAFDVAVIGLDLSISAAIATATSLRSASPATALIFTGDALADDAPHGIVSVTDPTDVVALIEALAEVLAAPSSAG